MNIKKLRKLRQNALAQQGHRCCYCGLPIWANDPSPFIAAHKIPLEKAKYLQCTAEHLVAQQNGGGETIENIAAACLWLGFNRSTQQVG